MAKRFGRNQRRAMRAAVDQARLETQRAHVDARRSRQESERALATLRQEIEYARRAGNTIRVDVDAMFDEREGGIRVTAAFDMARRDRLFSALHLDRREIDRRNDAERTAFIEHAGKIIAEHALVQVLRHWRSR